MKTPKREIIEAGAGCGKTTRLVSRYIEALGNSKIGFRDPSKVFAITFTSESASEMKERVIHELQKQNRSDEARRVEQGGEISTFHALLYRILKPYLPRFDYPTTITPPHIALHYRKMFVIQNAASFDEVRFLLSFLNISQIANLASSRVGLKELSLKELESQRFESAIEQFLLDLNSEFQHALASDPKTHKALNTGEDLGWISALKEFLDTRKKPSLFDFNFRKSPSFRKAFPNLYQKTRVLKSALEDNLLNRASKSAINLELQLSLKIETQLRSLANRLPKYLDFNLIEHLFLKLSTEDLTPHIPEVILVDEFQDTSPVQYEIIKLLSNSATEWFFVGDPKQSIYGFREAHSTLFSQLSKELEHSTLSTNYRTDPVLLEHLNQMSSHIFDSDFLKINSLNDPPAQNLEPARTTNLASPLTFYRFSKNSSKNTLFEKALSEIQKRSSELGPKATHGILFLKWNKLYEFAEFLQSRNIAFHISGSDNILEHPLTDIFVHFLNSLVDPDNSLISHTLNRWLKLDQATFKTSSLEHASLGVIFSRFLALLNLDQWENGHLWAIYFENFLVELEETQSWSQKFDLWDALQFLKTSKLAALSSPSWNKAFSSPEEVTIELLTIHASKGLQFDNVLCLELFESTQGAPKSSSIDYNDLSVFPRLPHEEFVSPRSLLYEIAQNNKLKAEFAEKKRLFYVAQTRAKSALSFFYKPRATPLIEEYEKKQSQFSLEILNQSPAMPIYWNSFLDLFLATPYAQQHFLNKSIQIIETEENESPTHESDAEESSARVKFFNPIPTICSDFGNFIHPAPITLGISQFVESLSSGTFHNKRKPSPPSNSEDLDYALLGENIHSLLELWSGDPRTLSNLLDTLNTNSPKDVLENALLKVAEIPELKDLWNELRTNPHSTTIKREWPIFLNLDRFALNGISDLVWQRNSQELVIIDWKSTHFANLENNPERLRKIELQLNLYAIALKNLAKNISVAAIQIYTQDSKHTQAKVLFWKKVDPSQIEFSVKQQLSKLQTQSPHPF